MAIRWPAAGVMRRPRAVATAVGSIRCTLDGQPEPPSMTSRGR